MSSSVVVVAAALCLGVAVARAAPPPERVAVAVVVKADAATTQAVRGALSSSKLLIALQQVELPSVVAAPEEVPSAVVAALATARRAWVNADFSICLERVGSEPLVVELLQARRRELAARVLFWRIACRVGAGEQQGAIDDARRFATLGLEVPPDVEAATPEVEQKLAEGARSVESSGKVPLRIEADGEAVMVSLDGRITGCAAPCTVDVPPGDHLVRIEGDGFIVDHRTVRVDPPSSRVGFRLVPAPPETAAKQWSARYGGSSAINTAPSLKLLARALSARRLVLLTVETRAGLSRLYGALFVDGGVEYGERTGVPAAVAEPLLQSLLVSGHVMAPQVSFARRPVFWAVLASAVAATAAAVGFGVWWATLPAPIHTVTGVSF